jgi:hypothetical protein
MLDEIREALSAFEAEGYEYRYGPVTQMPNAWKLVVVTRGPTNIAGPDFVETYSVSIVHEGFVPVGAEYALIKAVKERTHMAYTAISFDVSRIGQTDRLVESCTIGFSRPLKAHRALGE